jgi:hypothetical protein
MDIEWIYIAQKLELCFWSGQYWLVASGSKFEIRGLEAHYKTLHITLETSKANLLPYYYGVHYEI